MESGHFAGFFKNAPFDKRSVLRGFRGFSPPFYMTPQDRLAKGGGLVIIYRGGGRDRCERGRH